MNICDENGCCYEKEQVAKQFLEHFKKFLGTSDTVAQFQEDHVEFTHKLSTEEAKRMVRHVSDAEIKDAMFDIEDSKAPGPDGYIAKFFKAYWGTIGKAVCLVVQEFFN